MARVSLLLFLLFLLPGVSAWAAEPTSVGSAIVNASNVDIVADDGSLLAERLNVGDQVYVITNPKKSKKGWIRISRTEGDTEGMGWIESRFVKEISGYKSDKMASAPAAAPSKKSSSQGRYSKIAIVPFATEPGDSTGEWVSDTFSGSFKKDSRFTTVVAQGEPANLESLSEVAKVAQKYDADGIFVGKVSGEVGTNRLFQVRFYAKDKDAFIIEKVTKLPKDGNLKTVLEKLVNSCSSVLLAN